MNAGSGSSDVGDAHGDGQRLPLYLLDRDVPWWPELASLASAGSERSAAYVAVVHALIGAGHADLATGVADALLYGRCEAWSIARDAPGVHAALTADVARIADALARVAGAAPQPDAVPLDGLAPEPIGALAELRDLVRDGSDPAGLVEHVLTWRERHGGGPLGRFRASRWHDGKLVGVDHPARPRLDRMVDLDAQIAALASNTEAFLDGRPAMHALLYGPRGSGKSTVVRALLTRYAARGLRLVEVPAAALTELPTVLDRLRGRPERFLLFVDDLAFESGDARYHPLKTLLEGSIEARPDHVRLYATSNRRHLVQERMRERPDPLDDDVHAWDTQNERLALADRFGLLVTFPSADRRRYLEIVQHLAKRDGLTADDLDERADRFARQSNGYSGRTAQQFVDAVVAGLA